jgi:hypothetical protein
MNPQQGEPMSDHNTYIREEVTKAMRRRVRAQSLPMPSNPIPVKERSKFLTHFLASCIFLVFIATIFAVVSKSVDWKSTPVVTEKRIQQPTERYMSHSEASDKLSTLDSRMSDIESSFKTWNRRVWLLGIANNENATMNSALIRKYHPNEQSDLISFERDWKISRMPRSLNLEGSDKEKLQEQVK